MPLCATCDLSVVSRTLGLRGSWTCWTPPQYYWKRFLKKIILPKNLHLNTYNGNILSDAVVLLLRDFGFIVKSLHDFRQVVIVKHWWFLDVPVPIIFWLLQNSNIGFCWSLKVPQSISTTKHFFLVSFLVIFLLMLPKNLAKINDQIVIDWSFEDLDFSPKKKSPRTVPQTNCDNLNHLVSVNCLAEKIEGWGNATVGFLLGGYTLNKKYVQCIFS